MLAQGRRANCEVLLRVTQRMHLGWPRRISEECRNDAAKNWQGKKRISGRGQADLANIREKFMEIRVEKQDFIRILFACAS